jgi:hypothetical protein
MRRYLPYLVNQMQNTIAARTLDATDQAEQLRELADLLRARAAELERTAPDWPTEVA